MVTSLHRLCVASYNDIAFFLIRNVLYIDIKVCVLFLNLPLNSRSCSHGCNELLIPAIA